MHDTIHQIFILAQGTADEPNAAFLFWAAVLGGAAIIIIALELVVPSGGLLALAAGGCVVSSIITSFLYSPSAGAVSLGVYFILGPISGWFVFKWWLDSPLGKRFVLSAEVDRIDTGPEAAPHGDSMTHNAELRALIGSEGVAVTPLRPVGTVKILNERFDALAETGSIAAGARIAVTEVYDNQVKVREVE